MPRFAEKTFAVDRLWTFCGRIFCGFGQKTHENRKTFFRKHFLPLKYSFLFICTGEITSVCIQNINSKAFRFCPKALINTEKRQKALLTQIHVFFISITFISIRSDSVQILLLFHEQIT